MTDLFSEIEQDLRREQANKLWEKYGIYLIGLAVGIVLVASAVVGWRAWQNSRAEDASGAFDAVMAATAEQKPEEAAAALSAFAADTTSGYAALAYMEQGGFLLQAGDTKGAVDAFDKAAADTSISPVLRGMAQIKSGLLLVDTASFDDMNARLAGLDEAGNPWRNSARELLGLSAYKAGQYEIAETNFAAIIADNTASAGLRDRAHVMQALIAPYIAKPAGDDTAADAETDGAVAPDAGAAASDETPAQAAPDSKSE